MSLSQQKKISIPENYLTLLNPEKGITAVHLAYFLKFKYSLTSCLVNRNLSHLSRLTDTDIKVTRKHITRFLIDGWCWVDTYGHLNFKTLSQLCKEAGLSRSSEFGWKQYHSITINTKDSAYAIRSQLFAPVIIKSIKSQLSVKKSISDLADSKSHAHNPRYLPKEMKNIRMRAIKILKTKGLNTNRETPIQDNEARLSVNYFAKTINMSLSSGYRFKSRLIKSNIISSRRDYEIFAENVSRYQFFIFKKSNPEIKGVFYNPYYGLIFKEKACIVNLLHAL